MLTSFMSTLPSPLTSATGSARAVPKWVSQRTHKTPRYETDVPHVDHSERRNSVAWQSNQHDCSGVCEVVVRRVCLAWNRLCMSAYPVVALAGACGIRARHGCQPVEAVQFQYLRSYFAVCQARARRLKRKHETEKTKDRMI